MIRSRRAACDEHQAKVGRRRLSQSDAADATVLLLLSECVPAMRTTSRRRWRPRLRRRDPAIRPYRPLRARARAPRAAHRRGGDGHGMAHAAYRRARPLADHAHGAPPETGGTEFLDSAVSAF